MIIVITGPTGVGKTKLSESIAKKYDGIIINADAVQVYKKLNIGSAKIMEDEMEDVPHYLFDIKEVNEEYSVYDYQNCVRSLLEKNKNKTIILVGGTGLYISAALYDYEFESENKKGNYANLSTDELYTMALDKDKNMLIEKNNRVRLERFLDKTCESKKGSTLLYDAIFIGLTTPRENLYNIINKRVLTMFESGLLDEVKSLYKYKNESKVLNSAIGYKEVISYIDKKISYDEMVDLIQKNSRRYAKRQYTWFNNKMKINWFDVNYENFNDTIKNVENFIEKNSKI